MDIRQLTYFVAAVEEKTITAAAEKLHMTQPPLTMQLHMLEDELVQAFPSRRKNAFSYRRRTAFLQPST